jgi:hypothetical protein
MVIDLLLYKELEPDLQLLPEAFWDILRLSDKGRK